MPPNADPATLNFIVAFCLANLAPYGLQRIILFGSRSWTGAPKINSDHDFMAVVDNAAPQTICTGGAQWSQLIVVLNQARLAAGLGEIDLLVAREAHFAQSSMIPGTFPHAASANSFDVWP